MCIAGVLGVLLLFYSMLRQSWYLVGSVETTSKVAKQMRLLMYVGLLGLLAYLWLWWWALASSNSEALVDVGHAEK